MLLLSMTTKTFIHGFYILKNIITGLKTISNDDKKYKGTHIFADYKGLIGDEVEIGNFVFELMQDAIKNASSMKIVHKNLVILNKDTQGFETPPGFTSLLALLQLDSSHMTLNHFSTHSYTEEAEMGLFCIDVFTCCSDDTLKIITYFEEKIKEKYPDVKRVNIETHKRFKY